MTAIPTSIGGVPIVIEYGENTTLALAAAARAEAAADAAAADVATELAGYVTDAEAARDAAAATAAGLADDQVIIDSIAGVALVDSGFVGDLAGLLTGDTGSPRDVLLYTAATTVTLKRLRMKLRSAGGSTGTTHVLRVMGGTVPNLTNLTNHNITLPGTSGLYLLDLDDSDFGTITLAAGQHLVHYTPSGGTSPLSGALTGTNTAQVYGGNGTSNIILGEWTDLQFAAITTFQEPAAVVKPENLGPELVSLKTVAVSATPEQWVIVAIAGQSHGEPHSGQVGSIELPAGIAKVYYGSSGTLTDNLTDVTGDPIGPTLGLGDNSGQSGIAPAIIREIWARTGMGVIIVPCAEGGSGLISTGLGGGRNWGPAAALRTEALARIQDAMQAADDAGLAWQLGPIIWTQGGTEALRFDHAVGAPWTDLNGATITAANCTAARIVLFDWFRTQLAHPDLDFVISFDPPKNTGIQPGTVLVNQSHRDHCAQDPHVHLGYTASVNWATRAIMSDLYHGDTEGYDEMGTCLGRVAAQCIYAG